jgi:photosystem II stability/assembly factor-like uncharacterized protein
VSPNYALDGVVLAGTMDDGVARSADRGARWMLWNFGLYDPHILALALSPSFEDDHTVFVGTESGVFSSTTGGRSWCELPFPEECSPVLSLAISAAYTFDGVVFAGTEAHGLFRSNNRGQTWARVGEGAISDSVNPIILGPKYPAIPHLLVLTSEGIFVSRDAGGAWSPWPLENLPDEEVVSVAAPFGLDAGAALLVGTVGGRVLRTDVAS